MYALQVWASSVSSDPRSRIWFWNFLRISEIAWVAQFKKAENKNDNTDENENTEIIHRKRIHFLKSIKKKKCLMQKDSWDSFLLRCENNYGFDKQVHIISS